MVALCIRGELGFKQGALTFFSEGNVIDHTAREVAQRGALRTPVGDVPPALEVGTGFVKGTRVLQDLSLIHI